MREIWKPAKGFEGIYSVSNLGRVKREKSVATNGTGNYQRNEHIVKPRENNKGYFTEVETGLRKEDEGK